jgi:hypothetical protein
MFLTKCTAGTGKRGIYPWHGCPISKELNFPYMREEQSYLKQVIKCGFYYFFSDLECYNSGSGFIQ